MNDNDRPHQNMYQTFLERFRNHLPEETRAATMAHVESNLELMANGDDSETKELITQSVENAKSRFHLGPVVEFKTLEDVYQNLVLLNEDFTQTKRLFDRLKSDRLTCDLLENDARTVATVRIGRFTFTSVEAESITHLKYKEVLRQRSRIMNLAKRQFMSMMQQHCYKLNEKLNPNPKVEDKYFEACRIVGKSGELALNYYRRVLMNFKKNDCGIDLMFCDEMNKMDRIMLMDMAKGQNLRTRTDRGTLTVFSRRTGPEIVNDMINGRHPDLGEMYELEPPGSVDVASKPEREQDHVFTCGSLNYALSEAAALEAYTSLSHLEAVWIAQKFI